jgi:hypothetical protein
MALGLAFFIPNLPDGGHRKLVGLGQGRRIVGQAGLMILLEEENLGLKVDQIGVVGSGSEGAIHGSEGFIVALEVAQADGNAPLGEIVRVALL